MNHALLSRVAAAVYLSGCAAIIFGGLFFGNHVWAEIGSAGVVGFMFGKMFSQ